VSMRGVNHFHLVIGSRIMPMHTRLEDVMENEEDNFERKDEDEVEKSLLRKVDRRMSVLVLIYILNCKSPALIFYDIETNFMQMWIGITYRTLHDLNAISTAHRIK